MTFNNIRLDGMEAEIKTISNIITSTLRGSGKLVVISGKEGSKLNEILDCTESILRLKNEIFYCIIKGYEFDSYSSIMNHVLNECSMRYPAIYKKISNLCGDSHTKSYIIDALELIVEEFPIVILIDKLDCKEKKYLDLLKDISFFIPYNRFSIICTSYNKSFETIAGYLDMDTFMLHISLPENHLYELTESNHLMSLLNKSGSPCTDINLFIKLFFRSSIQLMNNHISEIYGLLQYLNDDDSLNYYEAMAYYIILLLNNGCRYEALIITRQITHKLSKRIKSCSSEQISRFKTLRYFILGNYFIYVNKSNTAISILGKGLKLIDDYLYCEYYNALGCAYMTLGDWSSAENCYLSAYEISTKEETFLPHLYVNLIQLYNFKCQFNRVNFYYEMIKTSRVKWKNDFIETFLKALSIPMTSALGSSQDIDISYDMIIIKLLNMPYRSLTPLYHFSYLRLYIIAGDHLFRCKDYASSMELYEKALINYDDNIRESYIKDFINIRIMACRSMLGLRPGRFISTLRLDYEIKCSFDKYMLCSLYFFAHIVYLSSNQTAEAKKYLIRCVRYAKSSGNLIYKGMGYYELYKLYCLSNPVKAKYYHKKYLETASAMAISPDNIPYTYDADWDQLEDNRINSIISYIKRNYKKDISLSMLAEEIHLSETHICHIIKEKTGYTFKELLLHNRIQEARKMLTGTLLNVSDIAAAVGFSSTKYFCHVFKEMCGLTPISYRKKYHNHNIKEYV